MANNSYNATVSLSSYANSLSNSLFFNQLASVRHAFNYLRWLVMNLDKCGLHSDIHLLGVTPFVTLVNFSGSNT